MARRASADDRADLVTASTDLRAAVGPRIRSSPFFDRAVAMGLHAVSTYNHMWLPMSYGDPAAEYRRLVTGVSLWDVAAQRHIEVAGPDATALVQATTIVDVSSVPVGGGTYAPMTDHEGVLVNDPVLLRFGADEWRFSAADSDIRLWLAGLVHATGRDCRVRELATATLAVQGPLAPEVEERLVGGVGVALDQHHRLAVTVADRPCWLSRSGWSGQPGFELFIDDPDDALAIWDAVAGAGADIDIGPGAPNATERIETGLLSHGTDTGDRADPVELGLGDLIDHDHEFIGAEPLRRVLDDGPVRRLRHVVIDGGPMPVLSHPCPAGDAGMLRAASWSPRFERNIGLALLDAAVEPGDSLAVEHPSGERSITVLDGAFADTLPGTQPATDEAIDVLRDV